MKRLSILLMLGLSMFFVSNANATFIGHHNYPTMFQNYNGGFNTNHHFNFPQIDWNFGDYEWGDWCKLSDRDCDDQQNPGNSDSAAVPEPSTVLLTLMGVFGLGMSKRKKQ